MERRVCVVVTYQYAYSTYNTEGKTLYIGGNHPSKHNMIISSVIDIEQHKIRTTLEAVPSRIHEPNPYQVLWKLPAAALKCH